MNRKKTICAENLNAIIANNKANIAIAVAEQNNPACFAGATIDSGVHLNKVVMRDRAFGNRAGRPFYAFVKRAGDITILVDVASGKSALFDDAVISSAKQVNERFEIKGVIYDQKDTVNGFPRYRAVGCVEKPRAKAQLKKALLSVVHEIGF